jgi:hypothetical protein
MRTESSLTDWEIKAPVVDVIKRMSDNVHVYDRELSNVIFFGCWYVS